MVASEIQTLIEGKRWILQNSKDGDLCANTKKELTELEHILQRNIKEASVGNDQVCAMMCGVLIPFVFAHLYIFYFN